MPQLRLAIDEPEIDPPAPFPIRAWRKSEDLDMIAEVERAFGNVQRSLDRLSAELDDAEPFPFPKYTDHDDGPWAA